jgi:hypothetical protein
MTDPAIKEPDINDLTIQGNPDKDPNKNVEPIAPPDDSAVIEVGGQKYNVTKEMADAMQAEQKRVKQEMEDYKAKLQSSQIQQPQQYNQPPQEVKQETPETVKVGDRIFEDPDGVLADFKKSIINDVTKMYQDDKNKQAQTKQEENLLKEFYSEFYKENKELKDDKPLVETILQANWQKWGHLSVDQVKERLADAARDTIIRHRGSKGTPKEEVVLEGGSQPVNQGAQPEPKATPDDGPQSLTDVLKSRAKARRQANK